MVSKPETSSEENNKVMNEPDDLPLTSGFREYPKNRNHFLNTPKTWLRNKKEIDNVHPYWRIHDKLYDLSTFIDNHPGGSFWLEETCGTDITELFECSHFGPLPEKILKNYFIKDISTPRNSPYTFHEDGFYRTLKRKVTPILAKVGQGPSLGMLIIQDSLFLSFVLMFLAAGWYSSVKFSIIAGILLTLAAICAHNFYHQKDNWRMYIFDSTVLSSRDERIAHVMSHHIFPNTIYDYEISSLEPHFKFLPKTSKTFVDRYLIIVTSYILFLVALIFEGSKKLILVYKKEFDIYLADIIPLIQAVIMVITNGSIFGGLWLWLVVHLSANFIFSIIGLSAGHHHPNIYHEGDALPAGRDWGLLQIVTTRDKGRSMSSLFVVAVTFGNHTLHHLFPTVDHSKLPYLMPALLETCKEFGIKFELFSFWKLYIGIYSQLANNTPNPNIPSILK